MTDLLVGKEQPPTAFPITIALFDTFKVTVVNQAEYKFRANKSRALLTYLLLAGGQPVLRTTLTELLWPNYLSASARVSLRQAVADLRKLFAGMNLLHAEYHSVQLRIDPTLVTCDALRFDELLAACEQHAHIAISACPLCQSRLREAIALYKGDLGANFRAVDSEPFNQWLERQRTAYAERLAQCQSLVNDTVGVQGQPLGNLPTPLTPLLGRDEEVRTLIQKLLHPVYRCLTLVGPGGIGKSRLALAVGAEQADAFPDGVWFVDLGALAPTASRGTLVQTGPQAASDAAPDSTGLHEWLAAAILAALGLSLQGPIPPTMQLQTYLQAKRALLILDNFEHLSDGAAYLPQLLQAAPAVRLLITSRHRLALQGQQLHPVVGLAWPAMATVTALPTATLIESYPSVALFRERAALTETVLPPDAPTLTAIAAICELVEGVPLALELAAALLATHTLNDIAHLIRENYQVLNSLFHDLPPRQRSAQAMLQTAWQLLTPEEAQILARCAVFQGGFTLAAAQTVVAATQGDLERLLHKSLLQQQENGRYRLHELVRQFATQQLGQAPAVAQPFYQRHAAYYLTLLAGWQPTEVAERVFRAAVQADLENVETAWHAALAAGQVDLLLPAVEGLVEFYEMTGAFYAAAALLRHSIAQVRALPSTSADNAYSTTTLLAALLMQLGYVYSVGLAQQEQAEVAATEALALAEALENTKLLIRSYHVLMAVAYGTSNFAHGQALGEIALQLAQGSELGRESAMCLSAAGLTATAHQDYATALPYLTQALAWAEAAEDSRKASLFRNQLGTLYREIGDFGQALRCFEQNLPATLKQDDAYNTALTIANLGLLRIILGDYAMATATLTEGYQRFERLGETRIMLDCLALLGYLCGVQGEYKAAETHCRRALAHPQIQISAQQVCWLALSDCYVAQGAWSNAHAAYTQLAAISQAPEALGILLLAEVGLATLSLSQGDRAAAHAAVEAPLARFDPTRFDTFFTAARFLLAVHQILAANDDLRAATILAQAWQIVIHFAEKISDPALRHAFRTNVPVHRQLGELIGG